MKVLISELFPFEDSGVSTKIANRKKDIEKGNASPIKVLPIDGDLLVVDGNNRVAAAKQLELAEMEAEEIVKREQEMGPYRDALEHARQNGWKGFENWPVDTVLSERAKRYSSELPAYRAREAG